MGLFDIFKKKKEAEAVSEGASKLEAGAGKQEADAGKQEEKEASGFPYEKRNRKKEFSLRKKQPRFFGIFFGEIPVSGQSDIQEAGRIRPEKKHEQRRV